MAYAHINEIKRVLRELRHYNTGANRVLAIPDEDFNHGNYSHTCAFCEIPRALDVQRPMTELMPDERELRELWRVADMLVLFEQSAWEAERAMRAKAIRYKMRMVLRMCVF